MSSILNLSNIIIDNQRNMLIVVFFNDKGEVVSSKKIVAVSQ